MKKMIEILAVVFHETLMPSSCNTHPKESESFFLSYLLKDFKKFPFFNLRTDPKSRKKE